MGSEFKIFGKRGKEGGAPIDRRPGVFNAHYHTTVKAKECNFRHKMVNSIGLGYTQFVHIAEAGDPIWLPISA